MNTIVIPGPSGARNPESIIIIRGILHRLKVWIPNLSLRDNPEMTSRPLCQPKAGNHYNEPGELRGGRRFADREIADQ